jgi:hypothetical protein
MSINWYIGCAKKPLLKCKYPEDEKGAISPIFLEKEIVGKKLIEEIETSEDTQEVEKGILKFIQRATEKGF